MDENAVRMQWFYANAVGGIKLQVPGKDAEAARAILLEMQTNPQKTDDLPDCPGCISLVNRRSKWNLLLGIVTFLLVGIPLLFIPRKTCPECGKTHRVL